jgi:hypothetical protein
MQYVSHPPRQRSWRAGNSVEDDDVLLPGEDPASIHNGDVEHWISVYQELLNGSQNPLSQMRSHGGGEMEAQSLERHIQRLEARLAFWTGRRSTRS